MSFGFGLFVFAFLALFQPFGLSSLGSELVELALIFGVICTLVMLVLNVVLVHFIPMYFNENQWTTGRQIFWSAINIGSIAAANALFFAWFMEMDLQGDLLLTFLGYTFIVGLFPMSIFTLWHEVKLSAGYRKTAELLESAAPIKPSEESVLFFPSESKNEMLNMPMSKFRYATSIDNYVKVVYLKNEKLERAILRTSLKQLLVEFDKYSEIVRVHKSYIANIKQVKHVSGNAQGLKLELNNVEERIPVSRSFSLKPYFE